MAKRISSRDNPSFRQLHQLAHSSRERRKQGRTVLDGMHLVAEWAAHFGPPELLAVSESGMRHPEIRDWLAAHATIRPLLLDDALFRQASPVDHPAGILAQVAIPPPPRRPAATASRLYLEGVQDAGNLGSILRSAAAAGLGDAFLSRGCAQAWSPRVLRAGMGAHFRLAIHEQTSLGQALEGFGGVSIAMQAGTGRSIHETDLRGPVAWIFGSEGGGLKAETLAAATLAACIPMSGGVESLNVAAAAAICLFEEARQKQLQKT